MANTLKDIIKDALIEVLPKLFVETTPPLEDVVDDITNDLCFEISEFMKNQLD